MAKATKKRNAQDTTLRNNRARQREIKALLAAVTALEQALTKVETRVTALENRMTLASLASAIVDLDGET